MPLMEVEDMQSPRNNRLSRKERRRLERLRKRQEKKLMKKKMREQKKNLEASIPNAMIAKREAEKALKRLKLKLVELQTMSMGLTGFKLNNTINLIDRINNQIKGMENLIEVYDEWIKRKRMIKKLGEKINATE